MKIGKYQMRVMIFALYLFQTILLISCFLIFPLTFTITWGGLVSILLMNLLFSFYLFNLKNVKGWWARKIFEANQRLEFKRRVESEIRRQMGLGYDKLEGSKAH